ncbi:DAK2 domain-containing protein [Saccharomonospora cyanea]|uniref:Putative kinase, dihydroxyacetone kinase n=1 Tax=Saccharomonospora cyanea NA-134 TaxID=882082 RepID=H5XNF3_9PSEU|nr:DAK2 domain-containing protein [Saccharomonospora cyanea]EHR59981.1 putative kinase, dihydroxyacetone kinase [Saccharomonospora cyanea NA-134]
MRPSDVLDADAVRQWVDVCVRDLRALRAEIDGINVYPVADSDTGSNLLHTITAARDALSGRDVPDAGAALTTAADAAVRAAKGNSGIILSQVLRGMASSAAGSDALDGAALAAALRSADSAATSAVARPVAGTMLSVLHAVSTALDDRDGDTASGVAVLAAKTAAEALANTPNQLAALAVAGVVDAGGRGLVAVLDALVETLTGVRTPVPARTTPHARAGEEPSPRAWEVMYLLTVPDGGGNGTDTAGGLPALRRALSALGDSVTVAEAGEREYAIHVHCADIGAALEAGLDHGRPHRVRVEPLLTPGPAEPAVAAADRAVVAVVRGEALADLVGGEGTPVLVVDADGEPTTEDLLTLVTGTAATHVTVLAGGVRLTAAAERITGHPMLEDRDVVVVPCASPVQVLAALAVHDPGRRAGADVVAMAEAAAATRRGEVVVAAEDAITWVGRVAAGDVVGFIDGEVVLIESGDAGRRVERAATGVLDRMLAVGGELVTVLVGDGAPDGVADVLAEHLRAERPDVELVCYPGGQTDAVLLMGVE